MSLLPTPLSMNHPSSSPAPPATSSSSSNASFSPFATPTSGGGFPSFLSSGKAVPLPPPSQGNPNSVGVIGGGKDYPSQGPGGVHGRASAMGQSGLPPPFIPSNQYRSQPPQQQQDPQPQLPDFVDNDDDDFLTSRMNSLAMGGGGSGSSGVDAQYYPQAQGQGMNPAMGPRGQGQGMGGQQPQNKGYVNSRVGPRFSFSGGNSGNAFGPDSQGHGQGQGMNHPQPPSRDHMLSPDHSVSSSSGGAPLPPTVGNPAPNPEALAAIQAQAYAALQTKIMNAQNMARLNGWSLDEALARLGGLNEGEVGMLRGAAVREEQVRQAVQLEVLRAQLAARQQQQLKVQLLAAQAQSQGGGPRGPHRSYQTGPVQLPPTVMAQQAYRGYRPGMALGAAPIDLINSANAGLRGHGQGLLNGQSGMYENGYPQPLQLPMGMGPAQLQAMGLGALVGQVPAQNGAGGAAAGASGQAGTDEAPTSAYDQRMAQQQQIEANLRARSGGYGGQEFVPQQQQGHGMLNPGAKEFSIDHAGYGQNYNGQPQPSRGDASNSWRRPSPPSSSNAGPNKNGAAEAASKANGRAYDAEHENENSSESSSSGKTGQDGNETSPTSSEGVDASQWNGQAKRGGPAGASYLGPASGNATPMRANSASPYPEGFNVNNQKGRYVDGGYAVVSRQPRGPPGGSDELGGHNFASRIRRKAGLDLSVLNRRAESSSPSPQPTPAVTAPS